MAGGKRLKGVSVCKPIIYGNTAVPMVESDKTSTTPADHTHKWTIFVKDPVGSDLSYVVKKVVFKLHDTYQPSSRTVEAPPFEVTETGWGEFEIAIRIFFQSDAGEKNVIIYHHLKLHPYGDKPRDPGGKVESVLYDEFVFNEPTASFFEVLSSRSGNLLPATSTPEQPFSRQAENEELDRIAAAMDSVGKQTQKVKEQILKLQKQVK